MIERTMFAVGAGVSASSRPMDRLTSLGSTRGSEDLGSTQDGGPRIGAGNPFQDAPQAGASQRPFGMGTEKTTEDMLRDIWARPLAGSQNQTPSGAGNASQAPQDGSRTSIASDFRAAMGVDRRSSGLFGGPFDAGESITS